MMRGPFFLCTAALTILVAAGLILFLIMQSQRPALLPAPPPPSSGSRAEILHESETTLEMAFFDAAGGEYTLHFTRATADEPWRALTADGSRRIFFGNEEPRFAGASERRALGVMSERSIQTFSTAIVERSFDDVSIYRTWSGAAAIGLWRSGAIVEIWYVGTLVDDLLRSMREMEGVPSVCRAAHGFCCAMNGGEPAPDLDACAIALTCGDEREEACAHIFSLCAMCDHTGRSGPACPPEKQALSGTACILGVLFCGPREPVLPAGMREVTDLLREIADRLQEVLDAPPTG